MDESFGGSINMIDNVRSYLFFYICENFRVSSLLSFFPFSPGGNKVEVKLKCTVCFHNTLNPLICLDMTPKIY